MASLRNKLLTYMVTTEVKNSFIRIHRAGMVPWGWILCCTECSGLITLTEFTYSISKTLVTVDYLLFTCCSAGRTWCSNTEHNVYNWSTESRTGLITWAECGVCLAGKNPARVRVSVSDGKNHQLIRSILFPGTDRGSHSISTWLHVYFLDGSITLLVCWHVFRNDADTQTDRLLLSVSLPGGTGCSILLPLLKTIVP